MVSLVAALSIPLALDGSPFPERDLVLVATFCVIAATLLGLGIPLPWVVRRLGLERAAADEAVRNKRDERLARLEGIDAVLAAVDGCGEKDAPAVALAALRRRHRQPLWWRLLPKSGGVSTRHGRLCCAWRWLASKRHGIGCC